MVFILINCATGRKLPLMDSRLCSMLIRKLLLPLLIRNRKSMNSTQRSGGSQPRFPGFKNNLVSTLSRPERMELIEKESELSLSTQAELLDISRASLYYKAVEPAAEEVAIKHRIDEV